MCAYLVVDQVEEGEACLHLQILAVVPNLLNNDRYDLCLHLCVALEDIHCVQKDVALLRRVLLRQQELNSLTFRKVFVNGKSFDFFFRLYKRCKSCTKIIKQPFNWLALEVTLLRFEAG